MRNDIQDINVDDLLFGALEYKTTRYHRETILPVRIGQSQYIVQEYVDPHYFNLDKIFRDFLSLFSKGFAFEQRSLYDIREGKKFFLGNARDPMVRAGKTVLSSRDMHLLIDQD